MELLIVSAITLGIILLCNLIQNRKRKKEERNMALIQAWAKITSKTTNLLPLNASRTHLFLTFEFANGTRKNFEVEREIYNLSKEGDEGILLYKENSNRRIFISFERQR